MCCVHGRSDGGTTVQQLGSQIKGSIGVSWKQAFKEKHGGLSQYLSKHSKTFRCGCEQGGCFGAVGAVLGAGRGG